MWSIGFALTLITTTILTSTLIETSKVTSPNSNGLIELKHQKGLSQSVNHSGLLNYHQNFQQQRQQKRLWNSSETIIIKSNLKEDIETSNHESNYSTDVVVHPVTTKTPTATTKKQHQEKLHGRSEQQQQEEEEEEPLKKNQQLKKSKHSSEEVEIATTTVGSLPLVNDKNGPKRKRQSNKKDYDSVPNTKNIVEVGNNENTTVEAKEEEKEATNVTFVANGKESKVGGGGGGGGSSSSTGGGISDKKIVIIVVCVSIGLVVCLLSAALLIKFYWGKDRDGNGGYEDVLQKDTPDGNSPMEEEQATSINNKDTDTRGQINMFAQIDEIDEGDSCPSSPVGKNHRRLSKTKDGPVENGETKPLLTYSVATPSSNMDMDSDSKLSEIDLTVNGNSSVENLKVGAEDEKILDTASTPSITEVQVEVGLMLSPIRNKEVERIYCRTGLSQSDYSISSFTSVNPSYCYGNQVAYMSGYYGYPCKEIPSPNYCYTDNDATLLLPPPICSDYAFPSQESDLDISVRATKDSGSDEVTMNGTTSDSMLAPTTGPSSLIIDNESEFSLGVNVDDNDVANCRECEDEDEDEEFNNNDGDDNGGGGGDGDDDPEKVQEIEKTIDGIIIIDDVIQPVETDSVQSSVPHFHDKDDDNADGQCPEVATTQVDSETKKSVSDDSNGTIVSSVAKDKNSTEVT